MAAFVTGKDAFTGLDMWAKIVAAVAVVCALSIGVVAVFVSNRAAYGWPELMKIKTDEDLLKWHDDRPKRLQKAARRIENRCLAGDCLTWIRDARCRPNVACSATRRQNKRIQCRSKHPGNLPRSVTTR